MPQNEPMTTIETIAVLLVAAIVVTRAGSMLIERVHPPAGHFVNVDGLRQHVVVLGESGQDRHACPVVLLHGASCNLEDMRFALGERLAARRRVILIDRPGLGWSERPAGDGSTPGWQASNLRGVLDRLGIERAIVVGHSWGGALALTFALDHPDRVAGLVLLAPPTHPRYRRVTWFYEAAATPGAGWLFAHTAALPFGALLIGPALRAAFLPQRPPRRYMTRAASLLVLRPPTFLANARDVAHLKAFLAGQVARYPTLAPPTVIITGDNDNTVFFKTHALAFAADAPQAKLVVLPGIGHMLHYAAADRIVAEIEALPTPKSLP
jgi:pimeloyl-ACP methyl ester carboxylesterase